MCGNKIKSKSQIVPVDDNGLVTDGKALAKMFDKFLVDVAATLGIKYENLPSSLFLRRFIRSKYPLQLNY